MQAKVVFRMKDRSEHGFVVDGDNQYEIRGLAMDQLEEKLAMISIPVDDAGAVFSGWNVIETWRVILEASGTPAVDKTDGIAVRSPLQKVRFDLLPVAPLVEVAKVFAFGAYRYGDRNWEEGFSWSRCIGAALRHFYKWCLGENNDDESGLHHLAHTIVNCMFLLQYTITNKGTDDRQKASPDFIAAIFKPINANIEEEESTNEDRE